MNWLAIIVVIASYLLGSIPSAYLAGKWSKGEDITKAGTGTTGAANVWQTISRTAAVMIFLADMSKGVIPLLVSRQLGFGLPAQIASGLAAIIGHNWSLFLRFRGGRGIAASVGVVLILAPIEVAVSVIISLLGAPLRKLALFVLVAIIILPFLSWYFGLEKAVIGGEAIIALLVIVKRLEANRRRIRPGVNKWEVLLYRFLYDRDIRNRKAWIAGRGDRR